MIYEKEKENILEFIGLKGVLERPGFYFSKNNDIRFAATGFLKNRDSDFLSPLKINGYMESDEVMKVKVGTADIKQELKTLEGLRNRLGEMDLRLDANQGLSLTTAIPYIKKTEAFEITFFEQPIDYHYFSGMAKICASVNVPIAADEGIFTADDVVRNFEAKSADIISLKMMKAGGITGVMRAAHVCEVLGFPIHLAAKIAETSVATAAAVHVGVCLPRLDYDCGTTNHYLLDDIVEEPLVPIKGRMKPTEKPGLGVEVEEGKLKKYLRE